MQVDVVRKTENPERLVCQAARGDYFDGYVGDTEYAELMESVNYDEDDISGDADDYHLPEHRSPPIIEAKTKAFVEKQLSRGHYGPWEHPQITFAVEGVSRVTMAQITRHRHMTFDVQSQRYVDFSDKEAIEPVSLTDPENHFSRETGNVDVDYNELQAHLHKYREHTQEAFDVYQKMVDSGVPKEDARFILPVGTPVNMTFSGNARTFMHLLDMRKKANAQWEIRQLSERLIEELKDWMPYTYEHYDRNAPHKLSP
jgi:thymidylate synthase (FAD)